MRFSCISLSLFVCSCTFAANSGYVGSSACGGCHKDIAAQQAKSNMRLTWQAVATSLPPGYDQSKQEGGIRYRLSAHEKEVSYTVNLPGQEPITLRVEKIVGGERHGLSFLARLESIGDVKLARAPLVETRYLHSTHVRGLALSPGFPEDVPASYETALGRVLSEDFEKKCLTCHGAPSEGPKPQAGVHCETCHGPGQAHLQAVAKGEAHSGILQPKRLSNAEQVENCASCHAGFSKLNDPMPPDLLISNQVNAMKSSECYIQSDAGFTCTTCHNPHANGSHEAASYDKACLGCHALQAQKAAACPVNAKSDCVSCHMPGVTRGAFTMVDHWIRVHPERGGAEGRAPAAPSHVAPKREFLRMLSVADRAEAERLRQEISQGASFFDVARKSSQDVTSTSGGYLGALNLREMDTALADAAVKLRPGQLSGVVEREGKYIVLQRLPRDFRWQALALEEKASALRTSGRLDEAIAKYTESLQIYPRFLRSLIFMAVSLGQKGQVPRAAAILEYANKLYPGDPAALYNLGISYGALQKSKEEIAAYRSAMEAEPGLIPAYLNLGAALLGSDQLEQAAETYQQAIRVNPLVGTLYYNLAQVRQRQGKEDEAKRLLAVAAKLDPKLR